MRLVTHNTLLALLTISSAVTSTSSSTNAAVANVPCPWLKLTPLSHEQVVTNWYNLWAGDYSLLDSTVMPSIQVYQDRFPTGNGSVPVPIGNASAFLDFVKLARADFETYAFIDDFHIGVENVVALRWTLNATFAGSSTAGLAKGSHVAYNGTDLMLLDPCSGLVQQVLSAQDFITFYHVLQQPIGIV